MPKEVRLRVDRLQQLKEQRGLGNVRLAELAGINRSNLQRVITGKRGPGSKIVSNLCDVFGVKFEDLFEVVEVEDRAA